MAHDTASTSITGRDDLVLAQALIYAIALIQSLPAKDQSYSNMCDMCAIARTIEPTSLGSYVFEVQRKTGLTVDIWPGDDDDMSAHDRHGRKALKFSLATFIKDLEGQLDRHVAENPLNDGVAG